jgi:transposase
MKKYKVTLTASEIELLKEITRNSKRSAMLIRNAYILLNVDEGEKGKGKKDEEVASILGVTVKTIENLRKKFVMESFETALYGKKAEREYTPKVDGDVEAHLIALSCSEAPKGFNRWSLRMLSEKMVELKYVDAISHETVRTVLKKRIKALESKRVANIAPK